jgi:hypothetical protein
MGADTTIRADQACCRKHGGGARKPPEEPVGQLLIGNLSHAQLVLHTLRCRGGRASDPVCQRGETRCARTLSCVSWGRGSISAPRARHPSRPTATPCYEHGDATALRMPPSRSCHRTSRCPVGRDRWSGADVEQRCRTVQGAMRCGPPMLGGWQKRCATASAGTHALLRRTPSSTKPSPAGPPTSRST